MARRRGGGGGGGNGSGQDGRRARRGGSSSSSAPPRGQIAATQQKLDQLVAKFAKRFDEMSKKVDAT
eukprot:3099046-Lingulodinium_polyedra.AAC.1